MKGNTKNIAKIILTQYFIGNHIEYNQKIFNVNMGELLMREKIFEAGISSALELSSECVDEQEFNPVGNSFFDRSYFGTRILILAPRPSDEIAIAGNMILNFTKAKAEIFIAYSECKTFDDELSIALDILNVPREKIISLAEKNIKAELKKILLDLRANIIFYAVDYKNLAATFESVLDEILIETRDYRPEVYQRFALATAINSVPDFYSTNLFSTRRPKIGVTDNYDFDVIDRANFSWKNRVRFPVHESCRKTLLKENPLANAILAYKSKHQKLSPLKILNSDEVFFERRTDNHIYHAEKNSDLQFHFDDAVQVQQIEIYGNPLDESSAEIILRLELDNFAVTIDKDKISIDNTTEIKMKLPARGLPVIHDVKKIFVRRAEIIPVDVGKAFSIADIKFFANAEPLRQIQPFIKLCIGKDFFYKYLVPYEVEKIPLSLYRFHVNEPVRICAEVDGENILTEIVNGDEEIILNLGNDKEIILTAEVVSNANIYDCAVIKRVSDLAQIQLKILQWIDKFSGK